MRFYHKQIINGSENLFCGRIFMGKSITGFMENAVAIYLFFVNI